MHNTLIGHLWPNFKEREFVNFSVLALTGSLLLVLSAKVSVPFYPVPMTMQTTVVLLLGMVYGWKLAGTTLALYMLAGALGLPVFSGTPEKGLGIVYMFGTTGGYLLGFVCATMACGYLAERGWGKTITSSALAMLIGNVIIYIPGLLWLGALLGWDKPILAWGLLPFILGDLVKLVLAVSLLPLCWRYVDQIRAANK